MKHFKPLDLPKLKLFESMNELIEDNLISWENTRQIGITTTAADPSNTELATGSLKYDWSKAYYDREKQEKIVPLRDTELKEEHFDTLCYQFMFTEFEEIYNILSQRYKIGRVRLMRNVSGTCLTWHTDAQPRIHFPLKTQEGCLMVIEEEVFHMEQGQWYAANTIHKHTAFNASKEDRIHLVVNVLEDYDSI